MINRITKPIREENEKQFEEFQEACSKDEKIMRMFKGLKKHKEEVALWNMLYKDFLKYNRLKE